MVFQGKLLVASEGFFLFFILMHRHFFIALREREREREREMRESINWLPTIPALPGDQTHNPGMRPAWESNPQPFSCGQYRTTLQPTEPHRPGPLRVLQTLLPLITPSTIIAGPHISLCSGLSQPISETWLCISSCL